MSAQSPRGLLLIGHGTHSDVGTRQFFDLLAVVKRLAAGWSVEPAFLELREPTIDAAVARLAARGATRFVAAPLLLFAAGHARRDVPDAIAAAVARHVGHPATWRQAPPLACHPLLLELSRRRLCEALAGRPAVPAAATCRLVVGRGSSDAQATAELERFARLSQEPRLAARLELAFVAAASPRLADALLSIAAQDCQRVVVQPHLLFEGDVLDTVRAALEVAATTCPAKEWLLAPALGDPASASGPATAQLAQALLDRCREAVSDWD